jgi:hypothetical protein
MIDIFIIGFIFVLFIKLGIDEKRLRIIKEFVKNHAGENSKNLNWIFGGCLIIDNQDNSKYWDGFAKIAVSENGVHFKSLFVGYLFIPWSNLTYSKSSIKYRWSPWLGAELSSTLVKDGTLVTSKRVYVEIEKKLTLHSRGTR